MVNKLLAERDSLKEKVYKLQKENKKLNKEVNLHIEERRKFADENEELKRVLSELPKALENSLGNKQNTYHVSKSGGVFWIEQHAVNSGEPLMQWVESEIEKLKNEKI